MTSLLVRYAETAQSVIKDVGNRSMSMLDGASELFAIVFDCCNHKAEFVGGEAMLFGSFVREAEGVATKWLAEHSRSVAVDIQDDLARFMVANSDLEQQVRSILDSMLEALAWRGFLLREYAITAVEIRATATNRVCLTFRAQGGVVPLAGYLVRDGSDSWRPLPGRSVELDFTNKYINFLVDHKAPHACRYSCAEALSATEG